jgi:hypothetical protein
MVDRLKGILGICHSRKWRGKAAAFAVMEKANELPAARK